MWSMISQDFSDFAQALKSESAGFMDYLDHMAPDVVGRDVVYAGDEVLKKATRTMPLSNELLRRLQEAEATYAMPIQREEKEAFAAWMKSNPLSSANAHRRQKALADEGGSEGASPARRGGAEVSPTSMSPGMTPNRRSSEWPDEPFDETRQRLLDYNEVVLQRYVSLVGDAVSPRSSMPGSPATPESRRRLLDPPSAVKFDDEAVSGAVVPPTAEAEEESNSPAPSGAAAAAAATAKPPLAPASPCPAKSTASAAGRISEDDFFDRYFFRLTQLRVTEAQRRPGHGDAGASAATSPAPSSVSRGAGAVSAADDSRMSSTQATPQSRTLHADPNADTSRQSTDDDFVAVPLFAKRLMTAASGFVTNIDNALNNAIAAETSRCSGAEGDMSHLDDKDESANVDPKDLVQFRGAKQQIADLELLVHELQETLRRERRRVDQLTRVLEAHHIGIPAELPSSTIATPAKVAAASATSSAMETPVRPADSALAMAAPTAAATSSPAAATSEGSPAAGASPAAATGSTSSPCTGVERPSVVDGAAAAAAPAEKEAGAVSVASEEEDDDDAWVNVNPSADQAP